jgi:hypothetical protein
VDARADGADVPLGQRRLASAGRDRPDMSDIIIFTGTLEAATEVLTWWRSRG